MDAAFLKRQLKNYFIKRCPYLSRQAVRNRMDEWDFNIAKGKNAEKLFEQLVDAWGNHSPSEILAAAKTNISTASLLDGQKSKYEERIDALRAKFKIEKLTFVGMETDNKKAVADKKQDSPAISLGTTRFQNKNYNLSLVIK